MNTPKVKRIGFSSQVQMRLNVNGFSLPIAQLGPDFLILRDPIDHEPCAARISLSVDGDESHRNVRLHEGIRRNEARTPISSDLGTN